MSDDFLTQPIISTIAQAEDPSPRPEPQAAPSQPENPDTRGSEEEKNNHVTYDQTRAVGFIFLKVLDLGQQGSFHAIELITGNPFPTAPVPTFNRLRPHREDDPVASGWASTFELANGFTNVGINGWKALTGYQSPQINSDGQFGFFVLLADHAMEPMHDLANVSSALSNPYSYGDRNFLSNGYAVYFAADGLFNNIERQHVQNMIQAGNSCTDETIEAWLDDPTKNADTYAEAAQQCSEFQQENNNGVSWLANSNNTQQPNNDSVPNDALITGTEFAVARAGNSFRLTESFNAKAGYFQTIEGVDEKPNLASYISLGALPAAEISLAYAAGTPLNVENAIWSFATTGVGFGQAATTDNPFMMRAYSKQNLIIGLGVYMPVAHAILWEAGGTPNPGDGETAVLANQGISLIEGGLFFSSGMGFGAGLDVADDKEKIALISTMALGQSIHTIQTGRLMADGHEEVGVNWLANTALFAGGSLFGAFLHDKKYPKLLLNHTDLGIDAEGKATLRINGTF